MANETFWFLSSLNEPVSTYILAIFTVVLALATVALAYYTYMLFNETKKMREIQIQPEISMRVPPEKQWINLIDLTIKNTGPGTAHNVKFFLNSDFYCGFRKENKKLGDLTIMKDVIPYMSSNQEFKFLLFNIMDFDIPPKLDLSVSYESSLGIKYKKDVYIDFSIYTDLGAENDYTYEISQSLEKIKESIEVISKK